MKRITFAVLTALTAVLTASAPLHARLDKGTSALINYVDSNGINVTIDDPELCNDPKYYILGSYIHSGMKRTLSLCPGDDVDAIDHATVRHEVWHAIQHCINVARGTSLNSPVSEDTSKLMALVNENVPDSELRNIRQNYDSAQWLLEYEAVLAENLFTAAEIQDLFKKACVGQ